MDGGLPGRIILAGCTTLPMTTVSTSSGRSFARANRGLSAHGNEIAAPQSL